MDLDTALRYLDSHVNLEATAGRVEGLSLERMRRLVEVMGDPQHAYPVVHITGTNGKGSTARMVSALLVESGLSVGTYTSPHLERLNERVARNLEPIDDDSLASLVGEVAALEDMAGVRPSYFEIMTAGAFRWFADVAVDVAVVEVGLLGRWDATNVADGTVAVVTNIGHDHSDFAGDWRARIAAEKAGIIKKGSTLVLGETDPDLRELFVGEGPEAVLERDVDFGCDRNEVAIGGRLLDLRTPAGTLEEVFVPLHGEHQGDNAAIALTATEAFFARGFDKAVVRDAFRGLSLPGRFEVVSRSPLVALDCAHNPEGAATAAATLADEFTFAGAPTLVVGLLRGRDPREMLLALEAPAAGLVVACTPPSPRAMPAADLAAAARELGAPVEVVPDVVDAVDRAVAASGPDDAVLVTGSFYVVGAARAALVS